MFISKDDQIVLSFYYLDNKKMLHLEGPKIEYNKWTYIATTYEDYLLKLYVNNKVEAKINIINKKYEYNFKKINRIQEEEKENLNQLLIGSIEKEKDYWKSEEGRNKLNDLADKYMYKKSVEIEKLRKELSKEDFVKKNLVQINKEMALQAVKEEMLENTKVKTRRAFLDSIKAKIEKPNENIDKSYRLNRKFCIGAISSSNNESKSYFEGNIAHVAYYNKRLSSTECFNHFCNGYYDNASGMSMLYKKASKKFLKSLRHSPDNPAVLNDYADAICKQFEYDDSSSVDLVQYQERINKMFKYFADAKILEGIASILDSLPPELTYRSVISEGFNIINTKNPNFYKKKAYRLLKILEKYQLLDNTIDIKYLLLGTELIKKILEYDSKLITEEDNVSWLIDIESPYLLVTLIKLFKNEDSFTDINLANTANVTKNDVIQTFSRMNKLEHLDISNCDGITEDSLRSLSMSCKRIVSLNLSNCKFLTDSCMIYLSENLKDLNSLDINNCILVGDDGIIRLLGQCSNMEDLNLSNLRKISDLTLQAMKLNCKYLRALHLQVNNKLIKKWSVQLTDNGFNDLIKSNILSNLNTLDISGCRKVTDRTLIAISKYLLKLKYL